MLEAQFAQGVELYGSQVLARGDIVFTSDAVGVAGASLISGGQIQGTTNSVMGFCGSGMDNNFEVEYFRLAI